MAGFTTSAQQANSLKRTLDRIITDKTDGLEAALQMPKYFNVGNMTDQFHDDLEVAGPGLASEKSEGAQITVGSITEGYLSRYLARTYAIGLSVTREALRDAKYADVIQAGRRCKRSLYKTIDVDAALVLARAEDTGYTGGDGLSLANASHTTPSGATFSNTMTTPMSPSVQAVTVATSAIRTMISHDGHREGYQPKKVLCPVEQWADWAELTKSVNHPDAGEFNAINVLNQVLNLEVVEVLHWDNTTTNWAVTSDAEGGLSWRWRQRPESDSWMENGPLVMNYSCHGRWARGWSNPRGLYFVGS